MGTSKALIKSLEELVAGGTKIHFFDSNDGYEVTVDATFAKELIQKYHLHETNTAPWRIGKNFFTYVNKEGRHFAILLYDGNGEAPVEDDDDIGYYAHWFQVIET